MPAELLIVGTGGLAKEVAQLARRIDPQGLRWSRMAYVTRDRGELGTALPFGSVAYLDDEVTQLARTVDVVIGIGTPTVRRMVAERLRHNPQLEFPNLIHPGTELDPGLVKIGCGNMITQGVAMTCDIHLGDFNLLNLNSTIGHDSRIGSFNVINPGCRVAGHVHLADECLLGTGCCILANLSVCSQTSIGAGAVVTKTIIEPGVYVGIPARRMRT
jgi:sugar O-acyltransferase (sialic acid O-acetyltransferase NeuD family)